MRPVVWSEEARQDYFNILRFIAADNPFAAEKVVDAIDEAGDGLGHFATGRPGRVAGTYEKLVVGQPYLIAYAIKSRRDGEAVSVLRVIHTSRDWPAGEWPE